MAEIAESATELLILFQLVDENDPYIIPQVIYFIQLFRVKAIFRRQEYRDSPALCLDDFFIPKKSFLLKLQPRNIPFEQADDEEYLDVRSERLFPTLSRRQRKKRIDELNLTRQNIHLISLGSLHLLMN